MSQVTTKTRGIGSPRHFPPDAHKFATAVFTCAAGQVRRAVLNLAGEGLHTKKATW